MSNEIGPKYVNPTKKYGLILTKNAVAQPKKAVKPCIFDDDDDLDHDDQPKQRVITSESRIKKQTQINIEKALEEDPNVFEYDSIYDKEKEQTNAQIKPKSTEPKYIVGLMKSAALRQMEYEKRQDRKIQKEREDEGDLYGDKESFVTEAYRIRMEERQKLEEEERNQDRIEALFDVRKAKDLSGFADTLLKMKTGELVIEEEGEKEKRLERERVEKEEKLRKKEEFSKKSSISKSYRARKEEVEEESSEEDVEETKENEEIKVAIKEEKQEFEFKKPFTSDVKLEIKSKESEEKEVEKKIETKDERWKRLFTKRTVGAIFDNELAEYYTRKNENLALKLYIERD